MRLDYTPTRFIASCSIAERDDVERTGFLWCSTNKHWYTLRPGIALKLKDYASESAKRKFNQLLIQRSPFTGAIPHPKNQTPPTFQLEGARYITSQNRSYIAGDPGVGKTIIAALATNALQVPTVYICPPFLVSNVQEEFSKWTNRKIERWSDVGLNWRPTTRSLLLVPDSRIATDESLPLALARLSGKRALFIVDEAHRFKTRETARSLTLYKKILPRNARTRIAYLSGTPTPNRLAELYPVLNHSAPECIDFMSYAEFGDEYCNGELDWRNKEEYVGGDERAAIRLGRRIIGPFMKRYRKRDVLPELPEKTESLIFVGDELPPQLTELNADLLRQFSPQDLMKAEILKEHPAAKHIATYRRLLGEAKIKPGGDYLEHLLSRGNSVLVFTMHSKVNTALEMRFKKYNPLTITGAVATEERLPRVKRFQNGESKLLLMNLKAGGIGYNVTRADKTVLFEYSWCPADNDQAIDRVHRIGRDRHVNGEYLVFRNSLDRSVVEKCVEKNRITKHI